MFKTYHTNRNVKNLAEFKFKLMDIVRIESQEFQTDRKPYTNDVTLSNNVMKDGLAYSTIKHIEHRVTDERKIVAFMKHGDVNGTFTLDDVDAILNLDNYLGSFDE